jgi:excisionase family DNA binding protein
VQVTIPEAAKLLRVSEHTIRRRLRNGELKGSQVVSVGGFAWMIEVPDDMAQDSQVGSLAAGEVAVMRALMCQMEAQIAAQQRQIDKQEATYHWQLEKQEEAYHWQLEAKDKQLETKDKQIEQLHVLLQQAQAALPSPAATQRHWWQFWRR